MADNILNSFLELWNEENPEHKLDDKIIKLLKEHIRYSYVAGFDCFRMHINEILKQNAKNNSHVSKYFLLAKINSFEKSL
jgi:hypothetical protein